MSILIFTWTNEDKMRGSEWWHWISEQALFDFLVYPCKIGIFVRFFGEIIFHLLPFFQSHSRTHTILYMKLVNLYICIEHHMYDAYQGDNEKISITRFVKKLYRFNSTNIYTIFFWWKLFSRVMLVSCFWCVSFIGVVIGPMMYYTVQLLLKCVYLYFHVSVFPVWYIECIHIYCLTFAPNEFVT